MNWNNIRIPFNSRACKEKHIYKRWNWDLSMKQVSELNLKGKAHHMAKAASTFWLFPFANQVDAPEATAHVVTTQKKRETRFCFSRIEVEKSTVDKAEWRNCTISAVGEAQLSPILANGFCITQPRLTGYKNVIGTTLDCTTFGKVHSERNLVQSMYLFSWKRVIDW